jgi:type IV pilus assembly protein PilA
MKYKFSLVLLAHSLTSKSKGFTLIELLVVIIIIGILAAISLPSFLNQSSKARQSEAKTYLATMNRAQEAYLTERRQFANAAEIQYLGLGFSTLTANYRYTADGGGIGSTSVTNQVQPNSPVLKAYLGGVSVSTSGNLLSTICEAALPPANNGGTGIETFGAGFTVNAAPDCPVGGTTGYISIR